LNNFRLPLVKQNSEGVKKCEEEKTMAGGIPGGAGGAAGGVTVAVAAAIINAAKASGAIVHVAPEQFLDLADKIEFPLIVYATGGLFTTTHRYLMPYGGLFFLYKTQNCA
jgi:hypothetical protein